METLQGSLFDLFFNLKVVPSDDGANGIFVFMAACAIIGVVAVVLDSLFYTLRRASLLKLKHGPIKSLGWALAWSIGAALMGYVGLVIEMFKVSLAATMIVGFGWPTLFAKALKHFHDESEKQTDGIQQI